MHVHRAQLHYTPALVGALMDPAFLRDAVTDANGERHVKGVSSISLRLRWRVAMHSVAAVFRRH
jgi:hypothetical protein